MDAGWDADQLLEELVSLSRLEIPQALAYLVRDVARSHGVVRGGDCVSYLRSEDVSMLAQVVADRKLRRHGLQQIAPTVLVSATPFDQLLDALRAAGYAPVREAPGGATLTATTDVPHQASPKTKATSTARTSRSEVDGREVVERLMSAADGQPYLIELRGTVVDIRSAQEHQDQWGLLP